MSQRKAKRERVSEILESARVVFSAKGYDAASMVEIAARAGIAEGTIYKHFKSKHELLFQVTRAYYEPLLGDAERQVTGICGARNQLRFLIWRYLEMLTADMGLCRVVLREIRPHEDESIVRDLNRRYSALIRTAIEGGARSGELRTDLPTKLLRDVVLGSVEHLVWRAVANRAALDAEAATDSLIDILTRGISNPRDEAQPDGSPLASPQLQRLEAVTDRLEALLGQTT